jgi:HlyD family secretion protein
MKRKLIIAGIVLAAGAGLMLFLRYGNTRDKDIIVLSGNVEVTEVNIGFKIPGRVRTLYTDEGRAVAMGDKIAALDSLELESMVNQGSAAMHNAEAQFEKAQKDLERYSTLFRDGVIVPADGCGKDLL